MTGWHILVSWHLLQIFHRHSRRPLRPYVPIGVFQIQTITLLPRKQQQRSPRYPILLQYSHLLPSQVNFISSRSNYIHTPVSKPSRKPQLSVHMHSTQTDPSWCLPLGLQPQDYSRTPQSGDLCPLVRPPHSGYWHELLLHKSNRNTCSNT